MSMAGRRVLLTGGSGLVGRRLRAALRAEGAELVLVSRKPRTGEADGERWVTWEELPAALAGVSAVVNLAGAPVALADWVGPWLPPGKSGPEDAELERVDRRLRTFMPRGSLLSVDLDPEHWLNWGLETTATIWFATDDSLIAEPPIRTAARFAPIERLHRGGLLWPEAAGRLTQTAYVTRESVGRGQIILFLNEPEFRGWTLGTRRLLLNALLYGPGLGTRWSTPL